MEDDDDSKKIKAFALEDDKLKILGELLSNKSSRDIIKLLTEKEMYTNEIAKKLDLRVNLVIHHLKKLEYIGVLEITQKKIVKKGSEHRYFKMVPNLFIWSARSEEELKEKDFFKRIFNNGVKISVVTIGCLASWYSSLQGSISMDKPSLEDGAIPWSGPVASSDHFILIPIIITGCSLFLIWFTRKRK